MDMPDWFQWGELAKVRGQRIEEIADVPTFWLTATQSHAEASALAEQYAPKRDEPRDQTAVFDRDRDQEAVASG